jgi:hypothetical protein
VGPLPGVAFRIEPRPDGAALVYRPPLSAFVDLLEPGEAGGWRGRATFAGREYGRFVLEPDGDAWESLS